MNQVRPAIETKLIICARCQAEHDIRDLLQTEPVRDGLREVVLLCPGCGLRTHSHFVTDQLTAERRVLQEKMDAYRQRPTEQRWQEYKTAQAVFQRHFDKVQRRWRRKLHG